MNLPGWCCSRTFLPVVAAWLLMPVGPADAQSRPVPAPNMPLPPCEVVDGVQRGACPAESEHLSGTAAGRFSAGGTVLVWTDPTDEVCDRWVANTGEMAPAPCYVRVMAPQVVGCATIDLSDGERFRELPCTQALYLDPQGLPSPLFSTRRPSGYEDWNGATGCGAVPDYRTFVYGGPATQEERVWRTRGPLALPCDVTFHGPDRPDGLYGPTWVKVRVSINRAVDAASMPGGTPVTAELYVPIDGDLRFDSVDVSVEAEGSVIEADWDNGRVFATYTATVRSEGSDDAENVRLMVDFPKYLVVEDVSTADCRIGLLVGAQGYTSGSPGPGIGLRPAGNVQCEWETLAAGTSRTVTIHTRITNATDLHAIQEGQIPAEHHPGAAMLAEQSAAGVGFRVSADDDDVESNNETVVAVDIPFRSGSAELTRAEMRRTLDEHFAYTNAPRSLECSNYKLLIQRQLEQIRAAHPLAFENLSYGPITSGYYPAFRGRGVSGGHVGVVVYLKGTNYRETGIIIHGTPGASPNLKDVSEYGNGEPMRRFRSATSDTGLYWLTAASQYVGFPLQEGFAMYYFEGIYPGGSNGTEFVTGGGTPLPPEPSPMDGLSLELPLIHRTRGSC